LKEYSVEEQGLKVMLGDAELERTDNQLTIKKKILHDWARTLFSTTLIDKPSPFQPQNYQQLISTRYYKPLARAELLSASQGGRESDGVLLIAPNILSLYLLHFSMKRNQVFHYIVFNFIYEIVILCFKLCWYAFEIKCCYCFRRDWDRFVSCETNAVTSSIPVGWVIPVQPSSDRWANLLQS
jgi:hypothetical protein